MNTKSILKWVLSYLSRVDIIETSFFDDDSETTITSSQMALVDKLLKCVNVALYEISTNYVDIVKHNQTVTISNASYDISSVSNFQKLISAKVNNRDIDFYIQENVIYFPSLNNNQSYSVELTYKLYAPEVNYTSTVDIFNKSVPEKVVAFGALMEYFFMEGQGDEATIYERRFKNEMNCLTTNVKERKLPRWRW